MKKNQIVMMMTMMIVMTMTKIVMMMKMMMMAAMMTVKKNPGNISTLHTFFGYNQVYYSQQPNILFSNVRYYNEGIYFYISNTLHVGTICKKHSTYRCSNNTRLVHGHSCQL